jgi:hypothetical protein
MQWLDFPPLAEFEDRFGRTRQIYGLSVLGRFEFAERMGIIGQVIGSLSDDAPWEQEYARSSKFRAAVDGALKCWGLKTGWFAVGQIEALLLFRTEDGEVKPAWLVELLNPGTSVAPSEQSEGATLAETIAAISSHCESLEEALRLAQEVPVELLSDVLKIKAAKPGDKPKTPAQKKREDYLKANFDKLMAVNCG